MNTFGTSPQLGQQADIQQCYLGSGYKGTRHRTGSYRPNCRKQRNIERFQCMNYAILILVCLDHSNLLWLSNSLHEYVKHCKKEYLEDEQEPVNAEVGLTQPCNPLRPEPRSPV